MTQILKQCTIYIKTKKSRKTFLTIFVTIKMSKQSWQVITINFVIDLSLSIQISVDLTYDIIIIVTDKFIKYVKFISTRTDISTETLVHILVDWVIKCHGMSEGIIIDKDKLLKFKFWETLTKILRIEKKFQHRFTHKRTISSREQIKQWNNIFAHMSRKNRAIEQTYYSQHN